MPGRNKALLARRRRVSRKRRLGYPWVRLITVQDIGRRIAELFATDVASRLRVMSTYDESRLW